MSALHLRLELSLLRFSELEVLRSTLTPGSVTSVA